MTDTLIKGRDTDVMLTIRKFPDRKRYALLFEIVGHNSGRVLGYFNSEDSAEVFIRIIQELFGGGSHNGTEEFHTQSFQV